MMKPIALGALFCAFAASAVAQTPSQRLIGTWACTTLDDGLIITAKQTYLTDGTSTIAVLITGETEGASMKIAAEGVGTWSFSGDQLDEELSRMTATIAEINGTAQTGLVQQMLDDTMVGQDLSSTTTFAGSTLYMVDAEEVETNCTR